MLPWVVAITMFTERLGHAIKHPDASNIAALVGLTAALGVAIWWINIKRHRKKGT
jgi:hypothetical protein